MIPEPYEKVDKLRVKLPLNYFPFVRDPFELFVIF